MKVSTIIEGLLILSKYYDGDDQQYIGSYRHVYMCRTDKPLSIIDANRLFDLNWFQVDSNTDVCIEKREYDPNYGWAIYI